MNVNRIALVFAKKPPPMTINENVKLAPSPLSSTHSRIHIYLHNENQFFVVSVNSPRLLYEGFFTNCENDRA